MNLKYLLIIALIVFTQPIVAQKIVENDFVIGRGQMPNITKDLHNNIHVVYGIGDSILYSYYSDNAEAFSTPALVAVLPHVYTFASRGPQIAATKNGLVITAVTSTGNIHSYYKRNNDKYWRQSKKVNDVDDIAKEGLTALSADGDNVVAVWLDLRYTNRNKIYSARSSDGGKSWSKNRLVYASPDSTVCECCKPSVLIKGSKVHVMFRNWLNGNRDFYLATSNNDGKTFSHVEKLGTGSWKLNGCPMDGGGMDINNRGEIQTVWRREGSIYTANPGKPEKKIGDGRSCTIETINGKNYYTWTENGDIVIVDDQGRKITTGKGSQPMLVGFNDKILCVWENEKQIHASLVTF